MITESMALTGPRCDEDRPAALMLASRNEHTAEDVDVHAW